jgi:hypothetical protein
VVATAVSRRQKRKSAAPGPKTSKPPVTTITTAAPPPAPTTTTPEPATTTTAPPPCPIVDRMPDFVGLTLSRVYASLSGDPTTTPGLDRHYTIVPPTGSIGPANGNDKVAAQSPTAGYCSTTVLASTLYLALP